MKKLHYVYLLKVKTPWDERSLYIGKHSGQIEDMGKTYFSSGAISKYYKENPNDVDVTILGFADTSKEVGILETILHTSMDIANSNIYFNKRCATTNDSNNEGRYHRKETCELCNKEVVFYLSIKHRNKHKEKLLLASTDGLIYNEISEFDYLSNKSKYKFTKNRKFDNKLVIPNIEKVNMALEIFDIFIKDTNCKLEDFISENEDRYDVNVLEVAYFNFKHLYNYFESDILKEYIKKMTDKTKSIQFLIDYIIRKERGNTEIQNWIFDNIKEDTIYTNQELDYLLGEYLVINGSFKRITRTGFKKIIKTYFEVEEKRIDVSKKNNVDKAYTRFSTKKEIYIKMKDKHTHNITLKTESLDDFFAN